MIASLARFISQRLDDVGESLATLRMALSYAPTLIWTETAPGSWQAKDGPPVSPPPRGARLSLHFARDRFLIRTVSLPKGARGYLNGIIASQIDRLSPWPAENCLFGHAVIGETETGLNVRIAACDRESLEKSLGALSLPRTTSVTLIAPTLEAGLACDIVLEASRADERVLVSERSVIATLFYGTIGMTLAVQIAAFLFGAVIDDRMAAARQEISRLRSAISASAGDPIDPVTKTALRKLTQRPAIETIDALARILPDNTSATVLTIEGNRLRIEGVTGDAAALIGLIGAAPEFKDPVFAGPTTRQRGGTAEAFSINAFINKREGVMP